MLLAGCGGGGESSTPEQPQTIPEKITRCFELSVKYTTNDLSARKPINDLYAVVYPKDGGQIYLDLIQGSGYKLYRIESASNTFDVDVFMFGRYTLTKTINFLPSEKMVSISVDTLDGLEQNTTGVIVEYDQNVSRNNQKCF